MIMTSNYIQLYGAGINLINKHSGQTTHDITNPLKAKNIRAKKLVCWSAITLNLNKQNYSVGPDYFFTGRRYS